ncbi:RHS repeat-associated core domain-containing protein [Phosphitispora sp. TUW77]|uniref:RHS repeat-associated core domain-containing protein n=1 Tax=Phosphitispora sp. TUW77 TaxID=3152361 RepID=UPI003AB1DCA5
MNNKPAQKSPENFLQFTLMILNSIIKSMLRRPIFYILMFLVVWVVHTYLMVGPNNGYWKITKWYLGLSLALKGQVFGGTLFWMLLVGFITSSLRHIKNDGLGGFIKGLSGTVPVLIDYSQKANSMVAPVFFGGAAAALLIACLLDNKFVSLLLALVVFVSISRRFQSLIYLGASLAWADLVKLFKYRDITDSDRQRVYQLLGAAAAGFLLGAVLPYQPYSGYLGVLILIVLAVVKNKKAASGAILFILTSGAILYAPEILAHDGGVYEAGGWGNWLSSQGALTAVLYGLPPAIASAIAAAIGLGAGSGISLGDVDFEPWQDEAGEPPAEEISDEDMTDNLTDDEMNIGDVPIDISLLQGGPQENPFTSLFGGDGPGICQDMGLPNYWINTATLNLVIEDTFFKSKGTGPAVNLKISYNSNPGIYGMMGRSWRFAYDSSIEEQNGTILVIKGSGQILPYKILDNDIGNLVAAESQPIELISSAGNYDRLLDYGRYWLFIEKRSRLVYRYDKVPGTGLARLTRIQDYNNNGIDLSYNQDGTLGSIRDAAGRVTRLDYNEQNLCIRVIIADGREACFAYDQNQNLIRTEDLLGVSSLYEYDQSGYLKQMKVGSKNHTTSFTYQKLPWGKGIASVTDARNHAVRFEMVSENPRQVRRFDEKGRTVIYLSNQGLTDKIIDPLGNFKENSFQNGLPVSARDINGNVRKMEYDYSGNLIKHTDAAGNVFVYKHDAYGNVLEETNPLGEKNLFKYDANFNLVEMVSSSKHKFIFEYDGKGRLTGIIRPDGSKAAFSYDGFGNVENYTDPLGAISRIEYDRFGFVKTASTDSRGFASRFVYDENNRLVKITYPDGHSRSITHDCCAPKSTQNEKDNTKVFERDQLLNVTKFIDSLGNVTSYRYDENSNMTACQDPIGNIVTMGYDEAGYLTELVRPAGKIKFKNRGNVPVLIEDERGKQTRFAYDGNNLLVSLTDPLGNKTVFNRDPLGRIVEVINSRGQKLQYEYNLEGRPAARYMNNKETCRYDYGLNGLLQELKDESGVTNYRYDGAGRVTSVTYPDLKELKLFYDKVGNAVKVQYPGDLLVSYEYSERNRVTAVSWNNNKVILEYDAAGSLISERRSNHTDTVYQIDAMDNIIGIKHSHNGIPFIDLTYTVDASGNLIEETGLRPLYWYPDPELIEMKAEYNDLNQIIRWGSDSYEYDPDGNLIQINGFRNVQYIYDSANRLVEINGKTGSVKYIYDGQDKRVKAVYGDEIRNYYYNPLGQLIFESDGKGNIKNYYIYAGMRLVAMMNSQGEVFYYHFDNKGSTISLTDSSGAITASYAYTPFGSVDQKTGNLYNPFSFVGAFGVMDEGNNLFFMKRRYYDSLTGKFMQKDPTGFAGGINLYAYVENNPLTRIDPEGTGVFLAAGLILLTFMAAGYTLSQSKNRAFNTIQKVLDGAPQYISKEITPEEWNRRISELGNIPDQVKKDFLEGLAELGDKILTTNPTTSGGYSAIKATGQAAQGDYGDAAWNAPGAIPGTPGSAWTAGTETYGAIKNACDEP